MTSHLKRPFCALVLTCIAASLAPAQPVSVPAWSASAIWYQIFVERFRNGDGSNDPSLDDIRGAWPNLQLDDWKTTPWGHDWYRQEDWAIKSGEGFYRTVQMRRYGGDLQGVLDKLDYLQELGVTAIYLNPINDSPSLHKYDSRNYRHVDRNFGPDPAGDGRITAAEDPADPASWQWTSADRLFLKLVREVHGRGMRIIVDYSWNHTGVTFWAWRDIVEKQAQSRYAQWYDIQRFDDPATATNEFSYKGWLGVKQLPEFKKFLTGAPARDGPLEGNLHPDVKQHVFAVTRRWLDPNGDGDCSDGVDGFRLDVAEHVPLTFWKEYREFVTGIRPDALLIAELWWEQWPDKMRDPAPWISHGVFHAVMNYRWYAPTRRFFTQHTRQYAPRSYANDVQAIEQRIPRSNTMAMMNVAATHDSPRLATSLLNTNQYKFQASPRSNAEYRIERPPSETWARQRLLLVQQFTWIGAPHIFYGDEVGMWGADDPDCRKPMIWGDIVYEPESTLPDGTLRTADEVRPRLDLLKFYQSLTGVRSAHAQVLSAGTTTFIDQGDAPLLVYRRALKHDEVIVVINPSDSPTQANIPVPRRTTLMDQLDSNRLFSSDAGKISLPIAARTARILIPAQRD